ncbi:hypothetical protein D3C87_1760680 [compost metagenome]
MFHGLDAFGDDLDIHGLADIDNGGDELALSRLLNDGHDQLAVNLEAARMQLLQRNDGGVSGAEIVDFDIDAQFLHLVDIPGNDAVAFVEIDRFHQFERQPPRRQLQALQALDQPFVVQAPQ